MSYYYVNKNAQPNGDHEVHIDNGSCPTPPDIWNRLSLGYFSNCREAVRAAKLRYYSTADGCAYCIPECHKK